MNEQSNQRKENIIDYFEIEKNGMRPTYTIQIKEDNHLTSYLYDDVYFKRRKKMLKRAFLKEGIYCRFFTEDVGMLMKIPVRYIEVSLVPFGGFNWIKDWLM
jgi:hypothetical protein